MQRSRNPSQRLLSSSISLFLGSTLLLAGLNVLPSDDLQIHLNLSKILVSGGGGPQGGYPLQLLASVLLTITFSIGQVVSALMFFTNELSWKSWTWMNLFYFLATSCSIYLDQSWTWNMGSSSDSVQLFRSLIHLNASFTFFSIIQSIYIIHPV